MCQLSPTLRSKPASQFVWLQQPHHASPHLVQLRGESRRGAKRKGGREYNHPPPYGPDRLTSTRLTALVPFAHDPAPGIVSLTSHLPHPALHLSRLTRLARRLQGAMGSSLENSIEKELTCSVYNSLHPSFFSGWKALCLTEHKKKNKKTKTSDLHRHPLRPDHLPRLPAHQLRLVLQELVRLAVLRSQSEPNMPCVPRGGARNPAERSLHHPPRGLS